jgi:hypothetical protein
MKRSHRLFALCLAVAAVLAGCSLSAPGKYRPDAGDVPVELVEDDGVTTEDVEEEDGPQPCPEGMERCGEACFDLATDPAHCGSCENVCSPDRACAGGACVCREGLTDCDGTCVDITSDPQHCGGCTVLCPTGWVCSASACSLECGEGLENCSGACVDLRTDPMHCGGCPNVCPTAVGADPACDAGSCGLVCQPNRWDLDGLPGCEYTCEFASGTETCNGEDDDCNGEEDETFPCARGELVDCVSECGTDGSGPCTAACQIPTGNACTPPDETCNGEDDDCDDACDNGFACCAGADEACTTACDTEGTSTCSPACVAGACCAAAETCGNLCDDNCNGAIDEACAPPNDTCDGAIDVTRGGRFTGSTALATDNSNPPAACGASNSGRDVYFTFTITSASDVFISSFGSSFDTVLYLGMECGGGGIGCQNNYASALIPQSMLRLGNAASGTYFITLDGNGASAFGDYVLDVYITPTDSPSDKCGHVVVFDDLLAGEIGSTCGYDDDYDGSCSSVTPVTGDLDRVYFFVIPNGAPPRTVTFSTCNPDSTITFDTLLYIRNVCSDPISEVACNDDESSCYPHAVVSANLGPGVHYLFMDGYDGCGSYRITVTGL